MQYIRKVAGVRVYEVDQMQKDAYGLEHYTHRRPYIYIPKLDIFFWGSPAGFHMNLMDRAKEILYASTTTPTSTQPGENLLEQWESPMKSTVFGSFFTDPETGNIANSIWNYEDWADKPAVFDRIQQVTGHPVNPEVFAEALIGEIGEDEWNLPPSMAAFKPISEDKGMFVDSEPDDQWWKAGCPNCGHAELDILFHGGTECPQCGWEGEMTQGGELLGMTLPTEDESDALWPDTLPWDESEQEYYRNARVAAEWLPRASMTRLGGFFVWTVDIHEKAQQVRAELLTREDVAKWMQMKDRDEVRSPAGPWDAPGRDPRDNPAPTTVTLVKGFLNQIPDEGFKLMPWWMREIKNGLFEKQQWGHALDIAKQAAQWAEWAREHNKPMPDYMKKDFRFEEMEAWVYELNNQESEGDGQWKDSSPVFKWSDGWHMDLVGESDLALEGELMGHCVGGYCNAVRSGNSSIYSLRDPKGQPHVTIEVQGDPELSKPNSDNKHNHVQVIQVQGKQDTEPIPEYRAKVDDWFAHLQGELEFMYVEEDDPEREPETEYVPHQDGPFRVTDTDDIFDYYNIMTSSDFAFNFGRDEDGEWEGNTVYYQEPRELLILKPLQQLAEEFASKIAQYDEDEIVSFVQGLWMLRNHANQQGYGQQQHPLWADIVKEFTNQANAKFIVQPHQVPQGQERMFSTEPYLVGKLPMGIQVMIEYMEQVGGLNQETYQHTNTRKITPEGWNDTIRGMDWEQRRDLTNALPTEEYQTTQYYDYAGEAYPYQDWSKIFERPEWLYSPAMQTFSHWIARYDNDDIATKALAMLHRNYGFSMDPLGNPVEPGYHVSYEGHERRIPLDSITGLDIINYIKDNAKLISETPGSFFGGWADDHGTVCLDVARSFPIEQMAQDFGRANHQEAIYDGFHNKNIPVQYQEVKTASDDEEWGYDDDDAFAYFKYMEFPDQQVYYVWAVNGDDGEPWHSWMWQRLSTKNQWPQEFYDNCICGWFTVAVDDGEIVDNESFDRGRSGEAGERREPSVDPYTEYAEFLSNPNEFDPAQVVQNA